MKRRSLRLFYTSLGCAVALAALATPASAAKRTVTTGDLTDVGPARPKVLDVQFDGKLLTEGFVLGLAKRPLVAWGGIWDEDGLVEGELWFTVARDDAFVYYHLTEEPNPNGGPTAYGGYTVKTKGSQTTRAYNLGAGEAAPVIGNDRDGFLVTTTELLVNSKFTASPSIRDFNTGEEIFSDRLVHVLDDVRSYNIPHAASAGRWAGWQALAPDGAVHDQFSGGYIASSSSSDCVAAAQSARSFVASTTGDIAERAGLGAAMWMGGQLSSAFGPAAGGVVGIEARLAFEAMDATAKFAGDVTAPLYAALAEAACELFAGTGDADLSLIEPELPGVEDINFVEPKMKCISTGTELVGSSGQVTDDGGIEVTGHTETVCTEWVYVVEE